VKFFLRIYQSSQGISKFETKYFLFPTLISLGVKSILQLFSALPILSETICDNHNLIIAYLHLIFIGILTFAILGILKTEKLIGVHKRRDIVELTLLAFGFLFSEITLIYPSLSIWLELPFLQNYYELLFVFSCSILVGTTILTIRIKKLIQ
jgi:hypothetical protein